MGTKGGIERFKEMAENYRDNPKILNKIIQNMVEKIEELEIDLQIATTRADALQNAFDRCEAKATAYDRLLAKKLTDEELDNPPASKILKEMAEKAEAYDRLMSGGKKTLKEWANLTGQVFVITSTDACFISSSVPHIGYCDGLDTWDFDGEGRINRFPRYLIDFTGDWKDSLTMPDGWEESDAR